MGLNMVVGVLAEDEDAELSRADFTVIRELLDLAWDEPELDERDAASFEMWGYSGLHTVRRLAVHLAENDQNRGGDRVLLEISEVGG